MEDKSLAEDVVSEKPFEERRDSALSEDLRNPEDMITVINRQAEQEEKVGWGGGRRGGGPEGGRGEV